MSDRRSRGPDCLDAETLAAFLDHRLDDATRARAEAHIADCEECYEAFVDAQHLLNDAAQTPTGSAGNWRGRRFWIPVGGLIAASVAAMLWLAPGMLRGPVTPAAAVERLALAVGTERFAIGRLSGPFQWGTPPSATRGAGDSEPSLDIRDAASAIERLAAGRTDASHLHALGVAMLSKGRIDQSIEILERARTAAPDNPAARSDLSAAYLERWRRDRSAMDAAQALNEAELAFARDAASPSARFNRALALEATGPAEAAVRAWQSYLEVDGSSKWAEEARAHLAALQKRSMPQSSVENSSPAFRRLEGTLLPEWASGDLAGRSPAVDQMVRIGDALRAAGTDPYLAGLVAAVSGSAAMPAARRKCLAEAISELAESRRQSDSSTFDAAARHAAVAAGKFRCAGLPDTDAEMQRAWSVFFDKHRPEGMRIAAAAAQTARQRNYERLIGRYEYMNGLALLGDGRMTDSVEAYERAIVSFTRAGDFEQTAACYALLAEAFREQGDRDAAWRYHQQALELLGGVESPRRQYLILSQTILTATLSNLDGVAVRFLDELIRVTDAWQQPAFAIDAELRKARVLAHINRTDEARRAIESARSRLKQASEAIRQQYAGDFGWTTGVVLQQADPAAAVESLGVAYRDFEEANLRFRLAEVLLVRGRAHRAIGNQAAAIRDWEEGARLFEDQRPDIRNEQLRISRSSELWDLFGELIDSARSNKVQALEITERARGRALLDSLGTGRAPSLLSGTGLHDWLPGSVTAFAYAVLPERLLVWRIRASGVEMRVSELPTAELTTLVRDAREEILRSSPGTMTRRLSEILLPADLAHDLTGTVAFLPDGDLHRVPFAALVNPKTGHLLIEDAVPFVAPSLTLMKAAMAVRRGEPRPLLVGAADGGRSAGLSALPEVESEIADLVRLYGPAGTDVLNGPAATRTAVLERASASTVIHFAGHALADELRPANARLLLSGPTRADSLTPADIAGLSLRKGTVVVLSACATAAGRAYRGEGPMSLARPFLAAGASAVVATLWPVSDRDAREIVVELHKGLKKGQDPATALAAGVRGANGKHPVAQWAAFVVIGS